MRSYERWTGRLLATGGKGGRETGIIGQWDSS